MESARARRLQCDGDLFAELYPSLRRFAAVVRPPEIDPDDLLQDALTRVLASGTLGELDDPGAYLRTVMVRLASNHRRSLGRGRRALERLRPSTTTDAQYPSDLDDLRRLAPADRAVLYLVVVERASYAEAAGVLGCSEQAARARGSRALRRLRLTFDADDQETSR